MPPTRGNGKICYIEIPASDITRSATFYQKVFGWQIRRRGDGATAFDDGVGEVSGTWVLNRRPAEPGFVIYIMVDDVAAACDAVTTNGGEIVLSERVYPTRPFDRIEALHGGRGLASQIRLWTLN